VHVNAKNVVNVIQGEIKMKVTKSYIKQLVKEELNKVLGEAISPSNLNQADLEKQEASSFFGRDDMTDLQQKTLDRGKELKDMKINPKNAYMVNIIVAKALGDKERMYSKEEIMKNIPTAAREISRRFPGSLSDEVMPEVEKNFRVAMGKVSRSERRSLEAAMSALKSELQQFMDGDKY